VDATLVLGQLEATEGAPFAVEVRETLADGLARAGEGDIDVILLDLTLPDTRGLETFFKTYRVVPQVPIVIITSLDDEAAALNAVRSGAQDYLVKGKIDLETLSRAVRFAIERHYRLQRLNPHLCGPWSAGEDAAPATGSEPAGERLFPPLRERDPDTVWSLVDRYGKLIQLACKQRQSRVVESIPDELHGLAMYLCMLSAGPSDVEEIHRTSLEKLSASATADEAQTYVEEGQLMLLELFRYLTDLYRDSLLRKPAPPENNGPA
jgi:CheY-like chemotaxis protein